MAICEVILNEKIEGLGSEADVVKVRAGYARNFLVPKGKAYPVTPVTLRKLNQLKSKRAEREAEELNEAQELSRRINKLKLTMILETGESGKAFGSITAKDLADKLHSELGGKHIDRHKIVLEHPIKSTGLHEVPVKLHPDVTTKISLNVKSSTLDVSEESKQESAPEEPKGYKAKAKARHK